MAYGRPLGYYLFSTKHINLKEDTMTTSTKLAQKRLALLLLAEKLGNVSKACRMHKVSIRNRSWTSALREILPVHWAIAVFSRRGSHDLSGNLVNIG